VRERVEPPETLRVYPEYLTDFAQKPRDSKRYEGIGIDQQKAVGLRVI
jgi:hypothetical protein